MSADMPFTIALLRMAMVIRRRLCCSLVSILLTPTWAFTRKNRTLVNNVGFRSPDGSPKARRMAFGAFADSFRRRFDGIDKTLGATDIDEISWETGTVFTSQENLKLST
jgi:hypothetical protein